MSKRAEDAAIRKYPLFLEYYPKIPSSTCGPDGFTPTVKDYNAYARQLFQEGYEQAEQDLGWHSVEESLPPIDEEVIVLTDIIAEDSIKIGLGRICFAHIVNPELTVEVGDISYRPISYSGWNIDGVKYWMPMPKIPNEDE